MKKFQFEVGYKDWYSGLYGGHYDFEVISRTENTVTFRTYWVSEDTWELCHEDQTYDIQIEESYGCQIEWAAIWEYHGDIGHQYCIDEDKFEEIRNEFNNEKENNTMTTINLTNNTASFTHDGITYRVNLETNRYSKVVGGKTTRIGKAEYMAAQNAKMAETEAKMHESLERLNRQQNERNEFVEITEEDIERDARELEAYVAEAKEDAETEQAEEIANIYCRHPEGTDLQKPAVLNQYGCVDCSKCNVQNCVHRDCMRRNPTSKGGLAECPRLKVKAEEPEEHPVEKKQRKAKKNAAFSYCPNGTDVITLTEKQVDFIRHLPDTCFWENGLDSCIWVDCLCDEIKGQFANKPMTVGAMISTICEKGLGVRATDRKGPRGGKCTSFALTDMGKQVAAELGLN